MEKSKTFYFSGALWGDVDEWLENPNLDEADTMMETLKEFADLGTTPQHEAKWAMEAINEIKKLTNV